MRRDYLFKNNNAKSSLQNNENKQKATLTGLSYCMQHFAFLINHIQAQFFLIGRNQRETCLSATEHSTFYSFLEFNL